MSISDHLGKYFLQYFSHMNGGYIYFAGDYFGPWARDLDKAKGYNSERGALQAKKRLALKESEHCPPFFDQINIIRVVERPVLELSVGKGTWFPMNPNYWK